VHVEPRTRASRAAAPADGVVAPSQGWVTESGMTWPRAVVYGLAAFVVSRLCVLLGAGVRASQLVVDANLDDEPRPDSAAGMVAGVFTSWDGRWYLEIVRNGYPR
jgi:hypothetical protein